MSPTRSTGPLGPLKQTFFPRNYSIRFMHVLEQMPHATFLVAPRTGAFYTINTRAAALTGWTRDELASQLLAEVIVDKDALTLIHHLEPGAARTLLNVPIRTRVNSPLLVDLRVSTLKDGGDVLALLQATPSDERQQQNAEKARQAHLMAGLHQILELFEAPTGEALNAAAEKIAQVFSADAVGIYHLSPNSQNFQLEAGWRLPPTLPPQLKWQETLNLQYPFTWSHHQRDNNALTISARAANWAHLVYTPLGGAPVITGAVFIAYQANKTPPTQAAAYLEVIARQLLALIRQMARYNHFVEAKQLTFRYTNQMAALKALVTEGFFLINRHGLVEDANMAGAQMLGYRPEDIIGLPYQDVLVGDDALGNHLVQALTAAFAAATEHEGLLHRRNGEAFPVKVRAHALPPTDGGCAIVLHDLSIARAERTYREHLDHMAYVGASAQAFAHEVRGPLNNIAVGVQYLAARLPETDPLQAAVEKILAETNRLSDLMNNMLAWAKPIDPKPEPLDLSALLQRLMTRWAAKLQQRHIEPNLKLLPSGPLVMADSHLLERVFINLIENAIQAMPAGGQLTLQINHRERGPQGQMAEVRVMDTGTGIPDEHRRRIFDPYFTTKADGTGLGLAICKRILTVHHGAIDVESFPGVGTIFIVTLPILADALTEHPPMPVRQEEMVA